MKLTNLRGILQYVPRFREKTFVLSIDAAVVMDEIFPSLLQDIAVLRSLNIRVVLVHGAAAQIKTLSQELGLTPSDLEGTGVTDGATLKLALTASNRLTHEILEGLSANDLRAVSTNAVIAHPLGILQGVDHLFTGKVERVDTEMLQALLGQGFIPIIPPLGFDGEGRTYRVNSDNVAVAVADALKAVKLMLVGTQDGILWQGQRISDILAGALATQLATKRADFHPDCVSKALHAAQACQLGIPRVHVINGLVNEALLAEVFSNDGIGTLVYANEYTQIRPAMRKDIRNILLLIKSSVESEELVKRTRASVEKQLGDYYVYELDRNIVGCVALHLYPEEHAGELACLFVSREQENQGIGKKLLQFVENRARELGVKTLFALSTQAFTYFQSKGGFSEGAPELLPALRREKYEQSGRYSKVLFKRLAPTSNGATPPTPTSSAG
ncbi:MAG: amino-acid N-acetyltransferase [Verrucomicrobia bacterium]|nr:amino-acid N-acetyltransferase [Verrucomicrobiota bacterium]MBI3870201.1 amino-acid N-acetyltransferase [Verrucomicrobiota bacterium]